jgi:hypothetical protein
MKTFLAFILLLYLSTLTWTQQVETANKKLGFLVGEWKSISVNHVSGQESKGESSIKWILGKTWLQWKFTAKLEKGSFEVLTLINYNKEKEKYAFYSFNPFDDQPLPHFGKWLEPKRLRLEIRENGEKILIDFIIKENGNFDQIHSRIDSSGKRIKRSTTSYIKIRYPKPDRSG